MSTAPPAGPAELTDLLRASADGDRAAFEILYRRTSDKLFGICVRMLRERGQAEEALQDVYINVWRRADRFDPGRATAMTWLITLARNHCIDLLRRRREVVLDDTAAERLADPGPGPDQSSQVSEQRRRLEDCLATLAETQRQAVCAAFFSGATYNQLAARLDVPLPTMKSWIRRSLIRLRSCLEKAETTP